MSIQIRNGHPSDAAAAGQLLASFQHQADWMPVLYDQTEASGYCAQMIDRGWVRIAHDCDNVHGFIARDGPEICGLYVAQEHRGRGIGKALINDAKTMMAHLWLRVHELNRDARAFYARNGFREFVSDGVPHNDEGLPELTCRWSKEAC